MSEDIKESRVNPAEYAGLSLLELTRAMLDIQEQKEVQEELLKVINAKYEYLRLNRIPQKMEEDDVELVTFEGIGRLGLTSDAYVSIKAGQKEAAYQWLNDTGHGGLIQPTVNASSLKAAAKEIVLKGEELPEELFNFTPFTRASITRKGVKGTE